MQFLIKNIFLISQIKEVNIDLSILGKSINNQNYLNIKFLFIKDNFQISWIMIKILEIDIVLTIIHNIEVLCFKFKKISMLVKNMVKVPLNINYRSKSNQFSHHHYLYSPRINARIKVYRRF